MGRPFFDFVARKDEELVRSWIEAVKAWGVNERGQPSDGGFGYGKFHLFLPGRDSRCVHLVCMSEYVVVTVPPPEIDPTLLPLAAVVTVAVLRREAGLLSAGKGAQAVVRRRRIRPTLLPILKLPPLGNMTGRVPSLAMNVG